MKKILIPLMTLLLMNNLALAGNYENYYGALINVIFIQKFDYESASKVSIDYIKSNYLWLEENKHYCVIVTDSNFTIYYPDSIYCYYKLEGSGDYPRIGAVKIRSSYIQHQLLNLAKWHILNLDVEANILTYIENILKYQYEKVFFIK